MNPIELSLEKSQFLDAPDVVVWIRNANLGKTHRSSHTSRDSPDKLLTWYLRSDERRAVLQERGLSSYFKHRSNLIGARTVVFHHSDQHDEVVGRTDYIRRVAKAPDHIPRSARLVSFIDVR